MFDLNREDFDSDEIMRILLEALLDGTSADLPPIEDVTSMLMILYDETGEVMCWIELEDIPQCVISIPVEGASPLVLRIRVAQNAVAFAQEQKWLSPVRAWGNTLSTSLMLTELGKEKARSEVCG